MRIFCIFICLLAFTNTAWAFQCPERSQEQLYDEAERAFLVYITETKLNEELYKQLSKGYPAGEDDFEAVKAIFATYDIIEEFKGDPTYKPALVDFLGISTGYVGLTPGVYFLVFLESAEEGQPRNVKWVNFCNVPAMHHRFNVERFQNKLDEFRAIRDGKITLGDQGRNYSLRTYNPGEVKELIAKLQKAQDLKYTNCSRAIDLPVGVVNGNHSYGFICKDQEENKVIYCHDIMVGRHEARVLEKREKVDITEFATFVAENCYGG